LLYESSDTTIAKIKNSELIAVGVGQCELTIQQLGNEIYHPIIKSETIIIDKANQTIHFDPIIMNIGDTVIIPTVYASSGLPVSLVSSDTSIAEIKNGKIYPKRHGNCYITATQPGNKLYYAAQDIIQELLVPTIADSVPNVVYTAYPNPSKGVVYISNSQGKRIELQTLTGETLFLTENLSNEYIDISTFPDGVYVIKIIDNEVYETLFIILQH